MNEVQYISAIIIPLIQYPEALKITKKTDEKGILLIVTVYQTDMGRVIGKLGATATSIRNLMRQYGITNNLHISIKIDEPQQN